MAGGNQTGVAEDDLRRRQEAEEGGVIVDGPAGGVEAMVTPVAASEAVVDGQAGGVEATAAPAAAGAAVASVQTEGTKVGEAEASRRSPGLGSSLDLPVKPDGPGSQPPPGVDAGAYAQQMQEKALRDRADAEYHEAIIRAIRDAIARDEWQRFEEVQEEITTFGLDPQTVASRSRLLREVLNDQHFGNLDTFGIMANELERQWRQMQSSNALGSLKDIRSNSERVMAVLEKAERGEKLNAQEQYIVQGKHLWSDAITRRTDQNLRGLIAAEIRGAQIPGSPAMRRLGQAETIGDILSVLIEKPGEILAVKAGQIVSKAIASTAGSLLAGPYGGVIAAAFVTFGSGYAAALLEGFRAKGIDLQNEDAVKNAIEKKELMREIFSEAFARAGIATLAEVASGTVGNIRLTSFQSGLWGDLAEKGAQGAVRAGIGVGGRIADGAASDRKPSLGELVDGGLDSALGLLIPEAKPLAF